MSAALELRPVRLTDPHAELLVEEVQAEYVVRYGGPDGTPVEPAMFEPPAGALFVGYQGQRPVAMGGWRRREDVSAFGRSRTAEVKRMYVRADCRRTGLARTVLAHLEATARTSGADLMVLETGMRQPEALRLYLSSGYVPIQPFGFYKDHPNARCFGKPV